MTTKHTLEPWVTVGDGADIFAGATAPCYDDATHIADCQSATPGLIGMTVEQAANAQRIVACINAMEGIDDPGEFVKHAKTVTQCHKCKYDYPQVGANCPPEANGELPCAGYGARAEDGS